VQRIAGVRLTLVLAGLVAACSDSPTEVLETSPNFSIVLSTNTLPIDQGGNGLVTATLVRTSGFTGAVTLTAERLGAGMTAESDVIDADETVGRVTIRVSANAPTGATRVIMRASAPGAGAHTVPLTVTVRDPTKS
jgi:hypothetical protein